MIIDEIIKWAIPFFLTTFFGFLGALWISFKKNTNALKVQLNAIKESQIAMLRGQIVANCEMYSQQGYLPDTGRFCLSELLKNYEILGGNHGIKALVEQTYKLPPVLKIKTRKKGGD